MNPRRLPLLTALLLLAATVSHADFAAPYTLRYPAAVGTVSSIDAFSGLLSFGSLELGLGLAATNPSGPAALISNSDASFAADAVGAGPGLNVLAGKNANGTIQIWVVDSANPNAPQALGELELPDLNIVTNIVLDDSLTTAYLAAGNKGLVVIDVSDRSQPTLRDSRETSTYAFRVRLDGGRLYVADGSSGLGIYDASSLAEIGSYNPGGITRDVSIEDGVAYLLDQQGTLRTANVSNPFAIQFLDSVTLDGFGSAMALGSNKLAAIVTAGTTQFLRVFDASDPRELALETSLELGPPGTGHDVVIALGRAYVAAGSLGLFALSLQAGSEVETLSDPFEGLWVASDQKLSVVIANRLATQQATLLVYENEPAPRLVGSLAIPTSAAGAGGLVLSEDASFAVLALGLLGVWKVDLSVPSQPRKVDERETEGFAYSVARAQAPDQFYAAIGTAGLRLVDFENPGQEWVKSLSGISRAVDAEGEIVAVVDQQGRLRLLDDDGNGVPPIVGSTPLSGFGIDLTYDADRIVVSVASSTAESLRVFDVFDPTNPVLKSSFEVGEPGSVEDVALGDTTLAIGSGPHGVLLYDASNLQNLRPLPSVATPGSARGVSWHDGALFVADATTVLDIVDGSPEGTPVPGLSPGSLTVLAGLLLLLTARLERSRA